MVKENDPWQRNNTNNCIEGKKKRLVLVFKLNEQFRTGQKGLFGAILPSM